MKKRAALLILMSLSIPIELYNSPININIYNAPINITINNRSNIKIDDLHSSFWANYNGFGNNPKTAFQWFKKYLSKRNLPGYMYKGLLHLFKKTNNISQIISLMPAIEDAFADDTEMQLLFVQSLQQAGLQNTADERVIRLLEKAKDNQEIAFHAAQVYLRRKEPENALKTIDDYLVNAPGRLNNFVFYFLKAQIFMLMDKKEEALAQLQKSLDIHPSFDKGWLMFGLLQEQMGRIKKAIKGYTTFLEISDSPIAYIQEHLLRLMFKQKIAEAQSEHVTINLSCFEEALLLFKKKKYRKALSKIDDCLEKEPRDKDSKVLKVQILNAMHKTKEAIEQVCSWIKADPHNSLWLELAHLIATQQNMEQYLIDNLRTLQATMPNQLYLSLYLADLYARIHQVDASIAQHKRAYQLTTDTHMRAQLLSHLAVLYYDYDKVDQMATLAKQAEALTHNFAPLHNVVAYYYATKGGNPVCAQKMIEKALAKEPRNPFYIDTQAMIYYKQAKYTQAQKLFEQSAQLAPDEPLVLKHLAKCYIKQNKQTLALSMLKKAHMHANINQKKQLDIMIRSLEPSLA